MKLSLLIAFSFKISNYYFLEILWSSKDNKSLESSMKDEEKYSYECFCITLEPFLS